MFIFFSDDCCSKYIPGTTSDTRNVAQQETVTLCRLCTVALSLTFNVLSVDPSERNSSGESN